MVPAKIFLVFTACIRLAIADISRKSSVQFRVGVSRSAHPSLQHEKHPSVHHHKAHCQTSHWTETEVARKLGKKRIASLKAELMKLHKKHPEDISADMDECMEHTRQWLEESSTEFTDQQIREFCEEL